MTSPWPTVEAARNRALRDTGRVFSYEQCVTCNRWFPCERPENEMPAAKCPLHDESRQKARKAAGERLLAMRVAP